MAVTRALRVGFVLHSMDVAGAEVLVEQIIRRGGELLEPSVLCLDAIGEIGERLRGAGVDVVELERQPGLDLGLGGRLARAARERDLQLLHAHQYTPFFYSALARLRPGSRFRLILTEHGRHYPDRVSGRRRLANRWLLDRLADAVTGCSDFSRRGLAEVDGFTPERILLIPNGVDLSRFPHPTDKEALRAELGLPPERTLVACVARFHPVKDHATLVRAFGRIARNRPEVDLVLAGDGRLRTELERQVEGLGLRERVHFLGVRDDVPRLLQAVDVFCMTSLSEAASLTVLEAMAASLPVVVTDVGGNPELVREGIDGCLVPRGDDTAVATVLERLVDDREAAAAMGAAGRERVAREFDLEDSVARYLELFRRVVDGEAAA